MEIEFYSWVYELITSCLVHLRKPLKSTELFREQNFEFERFGM